MAVLEKIMMTAEHSLHPAGDPIRPRVLKWTWRRATGMAVGAVYAPQFLMCLYTLGFVSCSHCKLAVWQVASVAPGLFIHESARKFLDTPNFSGAGEIAASCILTVMVIAGLVAWLRCAGRWRFALLLATMLVSA